MKIKIFYLFFFITNILTAQKSVFDIARSGTKEEIKVIHAKHSDTINSKNGSGFNPLVLACYRKNNEVASYLAEKVSNINENSQYGTALMAAVVKDNTEMVKVLLEQKANPNLQDQNGTTALHYAVMFQLEDIVKLLVDNDAKSNIEDNKGFTPKDYALKYNNEQINSILKL